MKDNMENNNMDELLKKALTPYFEPGDKLNGKIYEAKKSGKVVNMKNHRKMIKAAVIVVCILCAGTASVYAAINKMGISDYLHNMREIEYPEQVVEKLTEKNTEQKPVGDSLVEFRVREVMADDNNMVIQIEAVPKDPEHYILIDAEEYDIITDFDKQPLYTQITGNGVSEYSGDFFSESDGTLVYMLFYYEGTFKEGDILRFDVGYCREIPAYSGVANFKLEYQITSLDSAEKMIYEPQEDAAVLKNALGAQIKEISVYKSEASVKVVIDTLFEQASGGNDEKYSDIWYRIINEDGNELKEFTGCTGYYIGDGIYRTKAVYEYMEISDTLTIVAINPLDNSECGRFTVKCRED